jgi:intein/homing endonuclease
MSEDFGALTGNPVFFRTYSRLTGHGRESWEEMCKRSVDGLAKLGKFTPEEIELVARMQKSIKALPSGRWLWVGGTEWLDKPQNYSGAYNCTSTNLNNWNAFAFMMDLAMMGCGTGAVIEPKYYQQLPTIKNRIDIEIIDKIGETPPSKRLDETVTVFCQDSFTIKVGDSRQGWVEAYKQLLQVASDDTFDGVVVVKVSLANVRPAGEKLKQFGGVANPVKLENLFYRCANILNKAHGRKLTSLECCLLIDEAASTIVAGNIRRCLPGDALVHTESGLVPIAKIRIGDRVLTSKGFYPVTNFFDQGEQSLCRIKTQDGSFECTAEHKIAVLTDVYGNYKMVKAKDLKQGDRLVRVLEATELIPVKFVDIEFDVRTAPTYDIEVATVHEFVCEGILVSNSAGMRQFTSSDNVAANAKANLWEQTPTGEWRIDPEKDALRMANHTRVFHQKPTYQEVFDSVTSQYWSGEGAIQWAGEAVARANADLLITQKLKAKFLTAYENGEAKEWIRKNYPGMPHAEIEHRVSTYGLNPCGEIIGSNFHCVSGDTLLITKDGLHAIKDVVGCDVEIWNGRNWSQVQPFKTGSSRVLYRVRFADGTYLDATEYHRFFVKDRFGKEYKEVQTKDLMDASKYRIHTKPFTIQYDDGLDIDTNYAYSLGVAVGDGTTDKDNNAKIRLYGKKIALSVAGDKSPIREYEYVTNFTDVTNLSFSGEFLKSLKTKPEALNIIASWNREAILHFIAGLADTDGTNSSGNGIRIYISDYDRAYRIQLLLIKCGIRSSVNLCAYKGAVTNYGVRSKDLYSVQVTDCGKIPCQRLDVSQGRVPKCKGKWQVIRSVEQLPGLHDTYCFNEPQYHEGVFGNTLTGNCNLSEIHLNQLNPTDYKEQEDAFRAASLSVAALLHHRFTEPIYQESRELDPIVGVSFTGLFDFFVHAFGAEWLHWWQQEREDNEQGRIFKQKEQEYLSRWKDIVHQTVWEYCDKHNLKRPNRCTTVQPSGCLDRTALRIFDQGLLYADELIAPGSGEATNLKLSVREGVSVTTGIANQPLQLIKVTLNNGRVLRMTPNHRLSIDGNWIYASDMTPGMKIDFSLGEYQNSQETSLLDIDQFSYTREAKQLESGHNRGGITATIIKTPKIMSPDLAYFIGALFGNGCLSATGHRIRFSSNSYKLLERLQQIAQNLFVLNGRINKYSGREAYELSISSVQLYDWLQLNGIAKTEKSLNLDRIPLAIRCSSKQSILSFFCGLIDTDGCIRVNGSMSIDSASEEFIRNLQQIGEAVGLCFSVFHNTEGENNQTQKNMWGLCLSRMLSKPDALDYLNENSQKAEIRPIPSLKRSYKFDPYLIESVVWEETSDYSYDFAVQGEDDNDSWYWQGAIKSHNTKSLLTGASPGWHPPKAQQFIRRITFRKNDPVALACIDFGYNVVPSQSDKDENGNLLDNPFDERCTEWLVEIPVAVSWANLPGVDVDISKFSVLAQFDFYMQVQKYYTTHNTSATLELRQNEIGALSRAIYDSIKNNDGYISAAILSRFDDFQSYPRLPFEPISKDKYLQLVEEVNQRRTNDSFLDALHKYDNGFDEQSGPAPCDSDKCLLPELK